MQLNRISDAGADNLLRIYRNWLEDGAGGWRNYEAHLNIGLLAWRAGDVDTMRRHLRAAAGQAVGVLGKRDPGATDPVRDPSDVDLPLMLTLVFGDEDLKRKLARLPRQSWFQPETPEYRPLADLFDLLRSMPEKGKPDRAAIEEILALNRQPTAQLFYKPRIDAMCTGLLAVAERDGNRVEKAINDLLARHEAEALEGDWQYLVEGLVAGWALMLDRVARNAGIAIDVDSPYLPKAVI